MAVVDAGLAAASGHPGLLTQRALIDVVDGHPDEALQRLDRGACGRPVPVGHGLQRGLILRILGRSPEASRDIARAAELNRLMIAMSDLNGKAAQSPRRRCPRPVRAALRRTGQARPRGVMVSRGPGV